MGGYDVAVCEFNFKNRVGQYFDNSALALDYIAFSQNNSSFSNRRSDILAQQRYRLTYKAVCEPCF